jgi:hypothetical protein
MLRRSYVLGLAALWITAGACATGGNTDDVDAAPDVVHPSDAATDTTSKPDAATNDASDAKAAADAPADSNDASPLDTGVADASACVTSLDVIAMSDAGACRCNPQNASDIPYCQLYVACYATNHCNPHDNGNGQCGYLNGVCGVNTLGHGTAPQSAAITAFDCACGADAGL